MFRVKREAEEDGRDEEVGGWNDEPEPDEIH